MSGDTVTVSPCESGAPAASLMWHTASCTYCKPVRPTGSHGAWYEAHLCVVAGCARVRVHRCPSWLLSRAGLRGERRAHVAPSTRRVGCGAALFSLAPAALAVRFELVQRDLKVGRRAMGTRRWAGAKRLLATALAASVPVAVTWTVEISRQLWKNFCRNAQKVFVPVERQLSLLGSSQMVIGVAKG